MRFLSKSVFSGSVLANSVLAIMACTALFGCGKKSAENSPQKVAEAACDVRRQTRLDEIKARQSDWYVTHSLPVPAASSQTQLSVGTNGRAVVVVHGFISSPDFMNDISTALVKQGFTVITPLMTGFGSTPQSANASTLADWKDSVADAVELAKMCNTDVSVVGHSLGAAILTDELDNGVIAGISHVVLLAPFYKSYSTWPTLLSTVLASHVDVIDMNTFRTATGGLDPYVYLPVARPKPGDPEPYLPLPATNEALKLQATFAAPVLHKIDNPIFVVVSEADAVIDSAFALQFVNSHFSAPSLLIYEKAKNIEHSFQRRINNPEFDDLMLRIIAHLNSHL
jgi:esterase/lipase